MNKKIIVLIIIIIVAVGAGFLLWLKVVEHKALEGCNKIVEEYEQKLETANYCDTMEDCIILSLGCPFGCGTYINKKEEESLTNYAKSYDEKGCSRCMYECMGPNQPVCENNKCVGKICEPNQEHGMRDCACPLGTTVKYLYTTEENESFYTCIPQAPVE